MAYETNRESCFSEVYICFLLDFTVIYGGFGFHFLVVILKSFFVSLM